MNIFDYNSKFNQLLMTVADIIILNVLYLVCCIPVFTIGAAQAGLFTGIRVLLDKEDDSSCAKAFFTSSSASSPADANASAIVSTLITSPVSSSVTVFSKHEPVINTLLKRLRIG